MSVNLVYRVAIVAFTLFVLLDTFVVPRAYSSVDEGQTSQATAELREAAESDNSTSDATVTGNSSSSATADGATSPSSSSASTVAVSDISYSADGLTITISTERYLDTTVYVADIVTDDVSKLRTALACDTYGKNVTETTSAIAKANSAILAINGDYYGAQNFGYVIRNGVLYRGTAASDTQEDLVIYADGSFAIVSEGKATAQELLAAGAWQVLSFGPGLLENGQLTVSRDDEVDKAMVSNPRTAIGQIGEGHYVMVVADGRTGESEGLSLYELAEFMQGLGVQTAYNLDGGGSSTMYFNGEVVNNPTGSHRSGEREVSDIVYIGP